MSYFQTFFGHQYRLFLSSDSSLPLTAKVIEVLNPDPSLALTFSCRTKLRIENKKNNG
jgi:hypothetical protein